MRRGRSTVRLHLGGIVADARRHGVREAVSIWWEDLPWRHRRTWATLLREPGQGWLRWGFDEHVEYIDHGEGLVEPCPGAIAPPARRLWLYVRQWPRVPILMLIGLPPDEYQPKRYRFSWEEARPEWTGYLRSPDRGHDWR